MSRIDELLALADACVPPGDPQLVHIEFASYAFDEGSILGLRDAMPECVTQLQHYPKVGVVEASWVLTGLTPPFRLTTEGLRRRILDLDLLSGMHGCELDGFEIVEGQHPGARDTDRIAGV